MVWYKIIHLSTLLFGWDLTLSISKVRFVNKQRGSLTDILKMKSNLIEAAEALGFQFLLSKYYLCLHVYEHLSVYVRTCICGSQIVTSSFSGTIIFFCFCFLKQGLSQAQLLPSRLGWPVIPRDLSVSVSPILELQACITHLAFWKGIPGIKIGSSCLHNNYFSNQLIFTTPSIL